VGLERSLLGTQDRSCNNNFRSSHGWWCSPKNLEKGTAAMWHQRCAGIRPSVDTVTPSRSVHAYQGNSAHVADDPVVFDRLIRHRSDPFLGRNELIRSLPLSVFFAQLTSFAKPIDCEDGCFRCGSPETDCAPMNSSTVTWTDARSPCR